MGRDDFLDDSRLANVSGRVQHLSEIIRPAIETWLHNKTRMEATRALVAHDAPAGPVQTATEVLACPHVAARDLLVDLDYPGLAPVKIVVSPIRMGSTKQPKRRPPLLGEHTQAVLSEILGLDNSATQLLRAEGAI